MEIFGDHQHEAFFVESTSGGSCKPNYVVMKPTGAVVCDCEKFKETRLCSHSIAVSDRNGKLAQICPWWLLEELQAVRDTNPEHVAETEIPFQGTTALLLMTPKE